MTRGFPELLNLFWAIESQHLLLNNPISTNWESLWRARKVPDRRYNEISPANDMIMEGSNFGTDGIYIARDKLQKPKKRLRGK